MHFPPRNRRRFTEDKIWKERDIQYKKQVKNNMIIKPGIQTMNELTIKLRSTMAISTGFIDILYIYFSINFSII